MRKNFLYNPETTQTSGGEALSMDSLVEQTVNGQVERRTVKEWIALGNKQRAGADALAEVARQKDAMKAQTEELERLKTLEVSLKGFQNRDPQAIRAVGKAIGASSEETEAVIARLTGDDSGIQDDSVSQNQSQGPIPLSMMPKPVQDMIAAAQRRGVDPGQFVDMVASYLEGDSTKQAYDLVQKALDNHPKLGTIVRDNPKARETILKDVFSGVSGRVRNNEKFGTAAIQAELQRVSDILDVAQPEPASSTPSPFVGIGITPVGSRPAALHPAERPTLQPKHLTQSGSMAGFIDKLMEFNKANS